MKKFNFFKREVKENPVGVSLIVPGGRAIGGSQKGSALVKEGYQRNVIVYRAVYKIASAVASIKFDLHKGKTILETHPIIDLLKRPNPVNAQGSFLEEIFTNFLIHGEMCFSKNGPVGTKEPKELWGQSPLDISVIPGRGGMPAGYKHKKNNIETIFPVDQMTGACDLFFLKMFDPLNYWRGQAPLTAAALAADAHNEGLNWNYNLMRNGARPSGFIKAPGSYPGAEVIARLQEWFKSTMQGSANAGEVGILSGGAEWASFSENAKDMDFIAGMKEFAKYVSSAFGVPLPLIDNDAATMNNMEQAEEMLWTDTVIPVTQKFLDAFNMWLAYWYGEGLELKIDMDCIQALEGIRQKKFDRMMKMTGQLTINEIREEIGFDKYNDPNADKIFVDAGRMPLEISDVGYTPPPGFDGGVGAPQDTPGETPPPKLPDAAALAAKKQIDDIEREVKRMNDRPISFNPVINIPEMKQPDITLNPSVINIPAPIVNITTPDVTVHPPSVTVENHIKDISVDMPPRKKETVVNYDKDGNILRTVQVETNL